MRRRVHGIAFTFAILACLASCAIAQSWTIETLAENMGEVDFVIDDAGVLHALFTVVTTEPDRELYYAFDAGAGWQFEPVPAQVIWNLVSIAVDAGGVPHIAFVDLDEDVQYGVRSGGSWTFETPPVLVGPNAAYFPSIALDGAGSPHIAYQTYHDRIRYAYKVGGIWTDEEVTGSFLDISQSRVAMALGPSDELHVGAWDYFAGAAYFTRGVSTWTSVNFGQWGYMPWLVLDDDGYAHFTYYGPGTHYATNRGGSWEIDPIEPDGYPEDNDIALDAFGEPAIAYSLPVGLYYQPPDIYYDSTTYFAYKVDGLWQSEVVEVAQEFPNYYRGISRLDFDLDNVPHILYRDAKTDELRHAVRDRPTAVPDALPSAPNQLLSVSPNPFNPRTQISYRLASPARVRLAIYDLSGRELCVLSQGPREAGVYFARWDGRDGSGRAVASGVYFVRLEAADWTATRKLVLVR